VIAAGTPEEVAANAKSATGQFLKSLLRHAGGNGRQPKSATRGA